jgi:eukaryotic-like serine/threonine-protein kinase
MPVATPLMPPLHKTISLPGRRKVTLVSELGRGNAATAYRGILETDSFIRRPVVVKIFDLSSNDEPDAALLALGRAAQRAAYVVHPNAVQTYEMALVGRNHAAVVTELVEGTTLERLVRGHARRGSRQGIGGSGGRMPLDLALFVTTEIAEALSGARMATTPEGIHAGMAHLDVSLHQVLLSFHGEVKLSDFGLSQVALWGSRIRAIQSISERWASVAPEVAQGHAGDTRSDVFSLGIIFREMLIGPRFGADVTDQDAVEHTRDGFVPPTFHELQLPPDVSAILRRALETDPARRYSHATAMAYELRRVALSMGVGDGRMFLRNAIAEQTTAVSVPPPPFEQTEQTEQTEMLSIDPDTTEELEIADLETPRLVADRSSGLILKAGRAKRKHGYGE